MGGLCKERRSADTCFEVMRVPLLASHLPGSATTPEMASTCHPGQMFLLFLERWCLQCGCRGVWVSF